VITKYLGTLSFIVFSCLLLAVYILVHFLRKKIQELHLSNAIAVFISGVGIIGGIKVMSQVCEGKLACVDDLDPSINFLGGFSIMWVSLAEFSKKLKLPVSKG
jgi:hypothetical protein